MSYRIGIDLGGTNIAGGIVNENYRIVAKASVPTGVGERTAEGIAAAIADLCAALAAKAGVTLSDIGAVGIASPGIADHDNGVVVYSCNLPFRNFAIVDLVRKATGVANVHVENDANAAAWGEAVAGAARGTKNSVMITLGTGVGGGVIIDGRVFSGFNFAGTELGHVVIEQGGALCGCGRRGCWEAYSSATGLIRMTREKTEACKKEGRATLLEKVAAEEGKISGKTAFVAMRQGDAAAKEVVDLYARYLATGITNMINIFQPEVLSIGGGISGEKQGLLDLIVPQINAEQYGSGYVTPTRICIAELGNDAGIIGAAFLGISL